MTLTAAEQKTLDDIAAAQARGEDPFGDDDTNNTTTDTSDAAGTNEGQAGETTDEGEATGEASGEALDEATLQAIAEGTEREALAELNTGPDPLQFNAQVPGDYKATRAALLTEKAEAFGKMMEGELDAKEYAAIESRVMDSLEELSAQRIRAETLLEANAQTQAQAQQAAISALIVKAKDEVPYATDTKAQRQFDMALTAVSTDPDNAGKPFAHLVNEAHKVVMALRGVQAKLSASPTPAPRKPAGEAPMTLRSIPAAQTPNTGGSITDQLARLTGQEYEAAYAKLTPAQRASMLED